MIRDMANALHRREEALMSGVIGAEGLPDSFDLVDTSVVT
jgi:hypothetical protein